jgi:hypothetical protein
MEETLEETDTMPAQSAQTAASALSASSLTNLDNYSAEKEDNVFGIKELDDDYMQFTVKDAHAFEMFLSHDQEQREPASILNIEFVCDENQASDSRLSLIAFCDKDTSGKFMRT